MSDARPDAASVLVVIPVRNRPALVRGTLDTVAAQTRPPDELVVVDDGSTDDGATATSVERWIDERRPPFPARVLRQAHGGISRARNAGLAAAAPAHWVAFLDSDDLWPPDFLVRALGAVASAPTPVAVTADQRFVEAASGAIEHQDASGLEESAACWLLQHEPALCSSSLLRSDVVRELGGFEEGLETGEDIQLLLPMSLRGRWAHARGEPVTYQRGSEGGEDVNNSRRHDDRFRRWARLHAVLLARPDVRAAVPRRIRSQRLGYYWFEAGEELFRQKRYREARACFGKALPHRLLHLRTWSRWEKCAVDHLRKGSPA